MVKTRTLHFVNTKRGTYSQHWKKKNAVKVVNRLKRKGISARIVSKRDKWVY